MSPRDTVLSLLLVVLDWQRSAVSSAALTLVRCQAIRSWVLVPGRLLLCQIAWSRSFWRMASGTAEAELIGLGVGRTTQFRSPWPTSACRAKGEQAAELCCLIAVDGFDVQVQPVLGELRAVRNRPEVDLERATADPDRYAVAAAPHDLPAQRSSPELRNQLRVRRADDQGNNPVLHLYVLTHRSRTQPATRRDMRFLPRAVRNPGSCS